MQNRMKILIWKRTKEKRFGDKNTSIIIFFNVNINIKI